MAKNEETTTEVEQTEENVTKSSNKKLLIGTAVAGALSGLALAFLTRNRKSEPTDDSEDDTTED